MTETEFLAVAKERYGSRGLRQAMQELEGIKKSESSLSVCDIPAWNSLMMEIWLDSKERAKKFTPKKYRQL